MQKRCFGGLKDEKELFSLYFFFAVLCPAFRCGAAERFCWAGAAGDSFAEAASGFAGATSAGFFIVICNKSAGGGCDERHMWLKSDLEL